MPSSRRSWQEEWGTNMMLSNEERARKLVTKMGEAYDEAAQAIQDDINRILGAVISRNDLDVTPAQLRKRLSKAEVKTWKKTVGQYMAEIEALGISSPQGRALWMELEYLSALTRITRLEALQMSVQANAAKVAAVAESELTEHLRDIFLDDYYANMYAYYLMDVPEVNALMTSAGIAVTNAYVNSVVTEAWKGLHPYSERLWRNEYNEAFRMLDVLSQTLISGRSPSAVAREIAKRNEIDQKNLTWLFVTETAHVKTMADLESYEAAGFGAVEWCATLDKKTCPDCQELDGQEFSLNELIVSINQPPVHTRCRCCLLPVSNYLKNVEKGFTYTKFSRDEKGERVWVDGKMNYREWRASVEKKSSR